MFTTAATPWKNGSHLVDLTASRDLTVCGAAVTSMSVRRTPAPVPDWIACPHCRGFALRSEQAEHYRLCDEAARLGLPVSLDDPRAPRTLGGLRAAIAGARP